MAIKAQQKAAPMPRSDEFLMRNNTIQHAPKSIKIVVITKTIIPILPVCTQIKTYSESGDVCESILYLLKGGMSSVNSPIPIPHGASFTYLAIASLLTSRTFAEASFLSKAERILLDRKSVV